MENRCKPISWLTAQEEDSKGFIITITDADYKFNYDSLTCVDKRQMLNSLNTFDEN